MNVRQQRLTRIRAIIGSQEIGSQDELSDALAKEGFTLTQSSISRDLKLLKVVKGITLEGRSIYMLPENPYYRRVSENSRIGQAIQKEMADITFSGQLAVIKCRAGYAVGIANEIDHSAFAEVLGTVAGYDTIFVALSEGYDKETVESKLRALSVFL
mgnify:CR=1 FL=1